MMDPSNYSPCSVFCACAVVREESGLELSLIETIDVGPEGH